MLLYNAIHPSKGCEENISSPLSKRGPSRTLCKRCKAVRIGPNHCGELVCYECGLVIGETFDFEVPTELLLHKPTYKRIFYFNERCARWVCMEPSISQDLWFWIKVEAQKQNLYGSISTFSRNTVSKILRSVKLPKKVIDAHKSNKFKKNNLTKKRFYDKHFEKWKSILERLGKKVKIPPPELVMHIKLLFTACLLPFELYRHKEGCTKVHQCSKYHGCLQNFINYDFVFRKLLQVAEDQGFPGCWKEYKDDFVLVSEKIRKNKLRPIFKKFCEYNHWKYYDYE